MVKVDLLFFIAHLNFCLGPLSEVIPCRQAWNLICSLGWRYSGNFPWNLQCFRLTKGLYDVAHLLGFRSCRLWTLFVIEFLVWSVSYSSCWNDWWFVPLLFVLWIEIRHLTHLVTALSPKESCARVKLVMWFDILSIRIHILLALSLLTFIDVLSCQLL